MTRKKVDNYILDKRIGGGTYGQVFRGHDVSTSVSLALRCVQRKVQDKVARLHQEVRLLRRVSHANVLGFHGLRKSQSYFYLALEYCSGGNLAQLLQTRGPLPETESWRLGIQIMAGLVALHCQSFVHGNLQPRSILLTDSSESPKLKLSNFTTKPEPNPYTAPEVLSGHPCDRKADMWSAGAILYEMLFGRPPFVGESRSQLLASHFSSKVLFAEDLAVTGEVQAFCQSLLGHLPSDRPTSEQSLRQARYAVSKQLNSEAPSRAVALRLPSSRHSKAARAAKAKTELMWPFSSPFSPSFLAALGCSNFAQYFLNMLSSNSVEGTSSSSSSAERVDADAGGDFERWYNYRPGQRIRARRHARDPVTYFVLGQLQYSHFFRLRTARLFPRVLYAI